MALHADGLFLYLDGAAGGVLPSLQRPPEHVRLAQLFTLWVEETPGWEIVARHDFSVVCFRREGSDEENKELLRRVNASGEIFLSGTRLNRRFVIRLAVGNARTTEADVARAWELLRSSL
jgi:aromatic-L-amino-acid decarboxylase